MEILLWVKALHVISVIAWLSGLFYLPRLYVYHAGVEPKSETSQVFKVMERKLLRFIMDPAMLASWVFGLWLMFSMQTYLLPWFHVKLLAVVLMTAFHIYLGFCRRRFAQDKNKKSAVFYRYINEIPTGLMIIIVIMVIVQPF